VAGGDDDGNARQPEGANEADATQQDDGDGVGVHGSGFVGPKDKIGRAKKTPCSSGSIPPGPFGLFGHCGYGKIRPSGFPHQSTEVPMLVAIHQPHYVPWLGYLDRMARADVFIVLDHVQFERRNYQNRTMIRLEDESRWL